jgi:uncharacterized protein YdeI (YjbR/CyaY-like superfamily)
MKPVFFASAAGLRAWLAEHHAAARELMVGFRKRSAKDEPGLTWSEAVDEALCFGWIDGVRKSIDAARYAIRFAPRKPGSTWSRVNVRRIAALGREGRLQPAGRAAFERRRASRTATYSYENRAMDLDGPSLAALRRNATAHAFWRALPASYRRKVAWWIVSAKKAETRAARLAKVIAACAAGRRL